MRPEKFFVPVSLASICARLDREKVTPRLIYVACFAEHIWRLPMSGDERAGERARVEGCRAAFALVVI